MSLFDRLRREPDPDRRLWVRFPCDLFAGCYPAGTDSDFRWHARVRDVSAAGLRLFVNLPVEKGTFLSVEFPKTTLLAYVVRVSARPDNEWELGCVFSDQLSADDLEHLGAARRKPAASDRRGWERFPGSFELIYQAVQVQPLVWRPARACDISATGIGLEVQEAVLVGSLLQLELASGLMLAVVVRATETESGRRLGCSFVRELGPAELEALVEGGST